jgi:hypothetical protein
MIASFGSSQPPARRQNSNMLSLEFFSFEFRSSSHKSDMHLLRQMPKFSLSLVNSALHVLLSTSVSS